MSKFHMIKNLGKELIHDLLMNHVGLYPEHVETDPIIDPGHDVYVRGGIWRCSAEALSKSCSHWTTLE